MTIERFLTAQNGQLQSEGLASYATAQTELQIGHKQSHWMWYVFPQLRGLGSSERAQFYGLANRQEAQAFADHSLLGERLRTVTQTVLAMPHKTATQIFGEVDALKFQASMTLFAEVTGEAIFTTALKQYFDGQKHEDTLRLLAD
jgi:uncharacterized protein (DUF1810 family)